MAIYTKAQLIDKNVNTYFPNGAGLITALTARGFNRDFIDSIWHYIDNTTADFGQLSIWDNTKFGYPTLDNFIDYDDENEININSQSHTRFGFTGSGSRVKVPTFYTVTDLNDLTDKKYVDSKIETFGNTNYIRKLGEYDETATGIKNFSTGINVGTTYQFRKKSDAVFGIGRSVGAPIQVIEGLPVGIPNGSDFKTTDSESTLALSRISTSGTDYEILDVFNNGYSDSDYVGLRHISGGAGTRRAFTFDSVDHNEVGWANQYKLYMRINPSGAVGVGRVPSEAFKLDVDGKGLFRGALTTYNYLGIGEEPSVNLHVTDYGTAAYVRIQGAGDTDNFSAFELRDNAGTSTWQFRNAKNKDFAFSHNNGTSWSAPFKITSTGIVGINRNTPLAGMRLDVGGYVNADRYYIGGIRKDSLWDNNITNLNAHISDATVHRVIDDATISTTNLWSATKINSELLDKATQSSLTTHTNNTDIHRVINDSSTATTVLWSGSKISSEISGLVSSTNFNSHINNVDIHRNMNDDITDAVTLWSSNKIQQLVDGVQGNVNTVSNNLTSHTGNNAIHFTLGESSDTAYRGDRGKLGYERGLTGISYNNNTHILTLTRTDAENIVEDLSHTHSTTDLGLGSMALEEHTSYYTRNDSDNRFVNKTGDVMTGRLDINTPSASYLRLIGSSDGDNIAALELRATDLSSRWQFRLRPDKSFLFTHNNGTSWSHPFILTSDGTLGLNNTNPSSTYKLDVGGAGRFSDTLQLASSGVLLNLPNNGTTDPAGTVAGDLWHRSNVFRYKDGAGTIRQLAHTGTWSAMTDAEGQAGTATTSRFVRADRLKSLIEFHSQAMGDGRYVRTDAVAQNIAGNKTFTEWLDSSTYTTINGLLEVGADSYFYNNISVGGNGQFTGVLTSQNELNMPFRGTAGTDRVYQSLQGVSANDTTNQNNGAFIEFRTSTAAGYGAQIGAHRLSGGASKFVIKTGTTTTPTPSVSVDQNANLHAAGDVIAYSTNV